MIKDKEFSRKLRELMIPIAFQNLMLAAVCAFVLKLDPMIVYIILSLDEIVKIPWVYAHYKKYKWLKNITRDEI